MARNQMNVDWSKLSFCPVDDFDSLILLFINRFYVVSKRGGASVSYNHVYSLAHLLRVIKLPATVQLVVGPKPRNYWPELASDPYQVDQYLAGVYHEKILGSKSSAYFGSFNRRTSSSERNRRHHSKSLSEATFTAVLRLEDIRVRIAFHIIFCHTHTIIFCNP